MKRPSFTLAFLTAALALLCVTAAGRGALDAQERPDEAFFDDEVVHDIYVDINARDWQELRERFQEDIYFPCEIRWRDQRVRNVGIRSRGTGSRNEAKPGLRIDFDRYAPAQRFLGLKSVVLRNNTQDPSQLHERVSMQLFRRLGIPAPREAHARLYVRGEYTGLYTIVESIDRSFLARAFGDDAGYLYDYDYPADAAPYYFEYRGDDPGLYVPLPFKPETNDKNPQPEVVERLIYTINETRDEDFRNAIAEYLDLGEFVRYVAVEMFLADIDGILGDYGANNFYLYRFADSSRFTWIPWDKSEAFKGGVEFSVFHNIDDVPPEVRNRLMARALQSRDLWDLYLDSLLAIAAVVDEPGDGDPRGWLEREVARQHDQIREWALADPVAPYTREQFDEAIQALMDFARYRSQFVRFQAEAKRLLFLHQLP